MELFQKKKSLSSFQIIIFGFLAVILVGTLLLMLPLHPGSREARHFWMRYLQLHRLPV